MIITIGGLPGTGTTTIAKLISEKYNLNHVCAGFIFRDMAKEMGMGLQEFSKYAEENPNIDHEIDRKQVELAKEGNIVLEGRLATWMLKKNSVEPTISIWLRAPSMVRCERISERECEDINTALNKMINRENSEKKRYKELYDINIDDLSIYDIIINSSAWNIEGVFSIIDRAIANKSK
ncbi:cytidylate kinase, putative [Methanococcus aeolicus Nankai-3]|jgi:cytidylate kinase|uniref:Cytidylate kinase n=1 Tax=Methanococcus aeolicus (strain ATCC BAA-1280 / DSM 17508 / OCM 812 / Nankai-3) TaxID=419665 RepID=KCY_META3|nr:AAA family ATPase [Methanococcus aeolicus]A6UW32.1 RecName: Full=Cytidylate kinase; Short=CK; AltName: Full=Cytidine monophosphate kinase; Short=CMP kinase [Methanococcus aeolicus Nankai-3]ABR56704.1 cytidylate kinase, putative [Methanococcus aeolicus Nankai-3]